MQYNNSLSEKESISIYRNDPAKAARMLYKKGKSIKRWVCNNSGNSEDAEDVLQDAVIAFIQMASKPTFQLLGEPQALLFAIAKKQWFYQLRRRNSAVDIDVQIENLPEECNNEWVESELKMKSAEMALENIGEQCKSLLEFFYLHKKSMDWIAKKLEFRNAHVAKAMKYKCLEKARNLINNKKQ